MITQDEADAGVLVVPWRNFDFEAGSTRCADPPGTSPQLTGPDSVFKEHGPRMIVSGS
jgi:hypothetical protein